MENLRNLSPGLGVVGIREIWRIIFRDQEMVLRHPGFGI